MVQHCAMLENEKLDDDGSDILQNLVAIYNVEISGKGFFGARSVVVPQRKRVSKRFAPINHDSGSK